MKIRDIQPELTVDDDIDPVVAVKIFKAVIMSGKDNPNLSDYVACPNCGQKNLKLEERLKSMSWVKGTALTCDNCLWSKIADDWEYLPTDEQEQLIRKYGPPKLVKI